MTIGRIAFLAVALLPAWGTDYYAAPDAAPGGDGTLDRPWTLLAALEHPAAVQPGDRILLRGGVYRGRFISQLKGTAENPIVVRPFESERVILDADYRTKVVEALPEQKGYAAGTARVEDASMLFSGSRRSTSMLSPWISWLIGKSSGVNGFFGVFGDIAGSR